MKKRFNIVDAALILLLVAAVAVCFMFLRSRGTISEEKTAPMSFIVELKDVRQGTIDAVEAAGIGSNVYRSTDGTYFGKLTGFGYEPYTKTEYNESLGRYVTFEIADAYTLELEITGDGVETATDISVSGIPVKVGQETFVKGKGYAGKGYVIVVSNNGAAPVADESVGIGDKELIYSVRFEDVRDYTSNFLRVGDRLYDKATNANLGKIIDVDIQPFYVGQMDAEGNSVHAQKEGRNCAVVTLRARCTETEDSYYIDGKNELKVGAELLIKTKYVECEFFYHELLEVRALGGEE